MSAVSAMAIAFLAGWFFCRITTRPRRVLSGPGLDVARAVHRPEAREQIRETLKAGKGPR